MVGFTSLRSIVPTALAVGMLLVLVGAALSPDTGALPAQGVCTYGQCPASGTSTTTWEVILVLLLVIAGILGLLIWRGRRRGPPPAGQGPEEWQGPVESGEAPPGAAGETPYMERPDDVGVPSPEPAETTAAYGAAAGAGAAARSAEEPNIDSLMAELDKLSGEILKRGPPKKGAGTTGETTDTAER